MDDIPISLTSSCCSLAQWACASVSSSVEFKGDTSPSCIWSREKMILLQSDASVDKKCNDFLAPYNVLVPSGDSPKCYKNICQNA